jgi:hypothetical protein
VIESWFIEEQHAADKCFVTLETIPLNGSRLPTHDELRQLLTFFDRHEHEKVLVHCQAGADRTGLVAALFILEIKYGNAGKPIICTQALCESLDELAFSYGHYALFHPTLKQFVRIWYEMRKTYTRAESLEKYNPALYKNSFDISYLLTYLKTSH